MPSGCARRSNDHTPSSRRARAHQHRPGSVPAAAGSASATAAPASSTGAASTAPPPVLPTIYLEDGQLPRLVTEIEKALVAAKAPIFSRTGMLVEPVKEAWLA